MSYFKLILLFIPILISLSKSKSEMLNKSEEQEPNLPKILRKIESTSTAVAKLKKQTQKNKLKFLTKLKKQIKTKKQKDEFEKLNLASIALSTSNFKIFSIPLAKYFLKFSALAYCTEAQISSQKCCNEIFSQDNWVLITQRKVSYDNYNYVILANFKFKKIIIAFPGTKGLLQLIKELIYSNGVTFFQNSTEKIMSYLNHVYTLFKADLEKTLEDLALKFRNYQFVFTGHSLGGSIATISALNSVKYGKMKGLTDSPVLITFGQPRVGNDVFANELMKFVPIVYRVTRYGDIVTNIPPCNWIFPSEFLNKCKAILPEFKFDKEFELNSEQRKESEKGFYKWHLGGWMHFDQEMVNFTDCGKEKGENFEDERCQLYLDFDVAKHSEYFGVKVSELCQLD